MAELAGNLFNENPKNLNLNLAKTAINEVGVLNFDPITYYYNEFWEKKKKYLESRLAKRLFWQMPREIAIPFKTAFLGGFNLEEIAEAKEIKSYFLKNSLILKEMALNPTGFRSMEFFYCPQCQFSRPIDIYCWHSPTGQALRNRLQTVVQFLRRELKFYFNVYGQVQVLNLGSGLGRDSVLAYEQMPAIVKANTKTVCIDIDPAACQAGEKLAKQKGLANIINFQAKNILDLPYDQEFDLGLLVGILCPLSTRAGIKVLKKIKKYFRPGAKLVAVVLTEEMLAEDLLSSYIAREITGWKKLRFRPKGEIKKMLKQAGYQLASSFSEPKTCFYNFAVGLVP